MSWLRRLFVLDPGGGDPRSSNGASSFHLTWRVPPVELSSVSAVLTVVRPPVVDRLYFWALQVSFDGSGGGAGAHVGLQWLRGAGHANWGGYGADGRELSGSPAGNTHPFAWHAGRQYLLSVERGSSEGGWVGSVQSADGTGPRFERELFVPGTVSLSRPVVWSEVFARCDHPSTMVRWSSLRGVAADSDGAGSLVRASAVSVNYQAASDGGCSNTNSWVDGDGFVQVTNMARTTPQGAVLEVEA